jgi:hypothetical protein
MMRQRLLEKAKGGGGVVGTGAGADAHSTATIRRITEQRDLDGKETRVYGGWLNWKLDEVRWFCRSEFSRLTRSKKAGPQRRVITNVVEDLADGVALCQLAQVLCKVKLRFNPEPTLVPQYVDNCLVALQALASLGVTGTDARAFVSKDARLVLGFMWQLVEHEMASREQWSKPSVSVYEWVKDYIGEYPGVPRDLGPHHFCDGKLMSFLLHRTVPAAMDLTAMEAMAPHERLVEAIRGAKDNIGVPTLISAETVQDPKSADYLLLTYLYAYRACVMAREAEGSQAAAEKTEEKPAPREGKFGTLRATPSLNRAHVETLPSGPEHAGQSCRICEESLSGHGLLVKVMPDKILYHSDCFVCRTCKAPFASCYWPYNLVPYCLSHYLLVSGMVCSACKTPIQENAVIVHGVKLHSSCFVCSAPKCGKEFADSYNLHQGKAYCDEHYKELTGVTCSSCGLAIEEKAVKALGGLFHKDCFSCLRCAKPFLRPGEKPLPFLAMEGKPICVPCHEEALGSQQKECAACQKELVAGQSVSAMGRQWCATCFVCTGCKSPFKGSYYNVAGQPYDEQCARNL